MQPGAIVWGRFYSDGRYGVGRVVAPSGREIWTRVGEGYTPVRVIKGDRASGGYRTDELEVIE